MLYLEFEIPVGGIAVAEHNYSVSLWVVDQIFATFLSWATSYSGVSCMIASVRIPRARHMWRHDWIYNYTPTSPLTAIFKVTINENGAYVIMYFYHNLSAVDHFN